jgi:AmiR/NasT family two-component response regulator
MSISSARRPASRAIIGQANGMIMERYRVDAGQAFEMLKQLAQQSNTKLVEFSQRLINAEFPGLPKAD